MSPMPSEQFEHLHDYSNLSGLHVYGNLLDELYNLDVDAPVSTAGQLFKDLRILDRALITVYVVFVLAKAGYDQSQLSSAPDVKRFTTKFDSTDWTALCDVYRDNFLETWESFKWSEQFNKNASTLRVLFLDAFFTDSIDELRSLLSKSGSNLVVVHPRTVRHVNGVFLRLKRDFKQHGGGIELLSTGEFLANLVSDASARKTIENDWQAILDDILNNLMRSWPMIGVQQHRKLLNDSREYVRVARAKCEMGQLRDSMRDACLACEGILTIMTKIYDPNKLEGRPVFSDLLQAMRQYVLSIFGEDVLKDLEFIREWRNRASHVGHETPEMTDVLKVLSKVELFMNLFDRQVLTVSRRK